MKEMYETFNEHYNYIMFHTLWILIQIDYKACKMENPILLYLLKVHSITSSNDFEGMRINKI